MITMLFTIRYYSQFHRTQPELLQSLHQTMHDLVHSSGGTILRSGKETIAEFSEENLSFPILFFCFIQQLVSLCDNLEKKLFGYSILFQKDDELQNDKILKQLLHIKHGLGIYFAPRAAETCTSLFIVEPLAQVPVSRLKEFKQIPELEKPEIETVIKRFSTEMESSDARCKILLGNDTELLFLLGRIYTKQQFGDVLEFTMSFHSAAAELNGFIELFMQSLADRNDVFSEYTNKIELLTSERLHEHYNEHIQLLLQELLGVWLRIYKNTPVHIHIYQLHSISASLQPVFRDFLFRFVQDPSHCIFITAPDKSLVQWVDEIDRHVIVLQSQNRIPQWVITNQDNSINMKVLLPSAYLCHLLSDVYTKQELPIQLERSGFSEASIQWIFSAFDKSGLLISQLSSCKLNHEAERLMCENLSDRDQTWIKSIVQERLIESLAKHELNPSLGFLSSLNGIGGTADPDLILDCIMHDLANNYFSELDVAVQSEFLKNLIGAQLFQPIQYILFTDHILASGSEDDIRGAVQKAVPPFIDNPRINAFCSMNAAALQLVTGDLVAAGKYIKDAVLMLQDYKNKNGLEKVYRIFGLIELAQHRVEDSIEYFSFALDTAQRLGNMQEMAKTAYYSAVAYFILGNLPRAFFFADMAKTKFHDLDLQEWEQKCTFLIGRIQFTLGDYKKAVESFKSIQDISVASLWEMRARLYASPINKSLIKELMYTYESLSVPDALLEIEFHYFLGNYEACIQLADVALNTEAHTFPRLTEQLDWTDGYAHIESILFPQRQFLYRQLSCLKVLSMGQLKQDDHSIVSMLDTLLDELKPGEYDPYDVFYYTCYYLTLQRVATNEIDRATALSGAFKRLQKRASRIEDAELRRGYLTANYWNGLLSSAAKLHNLI